MKRVLLPLTLFFLGCTSEARDPGDLPGGELGVNDVSVLFPIPGTLDEGVKLDGGNDAPNLLSTTLYDGLGFRDLELDDWTAVAVRIDPCFPGSAECRKQVRVVAQPMTDREDSLEFEDSAIHLLFDLSDDDFEQIRLQWLNLPRTDASTPLGVHPVLEREGWSGAFGMQLLTLLGDVVRSGALNEVATMAGTSLSWDFRLFTVFDEQASPAPIPLIDEPEQFFTTLLPQDAFNMQPPSEVDDALEPLAGTAAGEIGGPWELVAPPEEVAEALDLTVRLDDPASEFHPGSVSCVACHVATRLRERALDAGVAWEEPDLEATVAIDPELRGSGQMVRAFGYFRRSPVITQRTVNESLRVADVLAD